MNDYKPGDKVTLEHEDGSKLVDRAIHTDGRGAYPAALVLESFWDLDNLPEGWRVTAHTPKAEPLPTEPGIYWVCDPGSPGGFEIIHKIGDGRWVDHNDGHYLHPEQLAKYRDYRRLVEAGTEREQAIREVLNWIRDAEWSPGIRLAPMIAATRKQFGINP